MGVNLPQIQSFYHLNSHRIFFYLFLLIFTAQVFFWSKTQAIKPKFDIIPPAPSHYFTSVASLGDQNFLFYILAARLQNSGDVFAGFVALKNYDYSRLYQWMRRLDELNSKSNLVPALASYYYSQTQNRQDTRYMVDYLDEHVAKNPEEKWWWLVQAIYIAKDLLKDQNRALDLAYKLSKIEGEKLPFWTKQMPAFISKEMGDGCTAFAIIQNLIVEGESGKRKIDAKEMNFMRHFINERLRKLKNQKFDPRNCR